MSSLSTLLVSVTATLVSVTASVSSASPVKTRFRLAAATRSVSSTRARARLTNLEPFGVPGSTITSAPPGATLCHRDVTVSSILRWPPDAAAMSPGGAKPGLPKFVTSSPSEYAATTRSKDAFECSDRRDATVFTAPLSPHGCGSGRGLPVGLDRNFMPCPSSCKSTSSLAALATRRAKVIISGLASTSVALDTRSPEEKPPTPKDCLNTSRAAHSEGAGPAPKSKSVFGTNSGHRSRSSSSARRCAPYVMGRRATAYAAASRGPYVAAPGRSFRGVFFSFSLSFPFAKLARAAAFCAKPSITALCFFWERATPHSTSRIRSAF
mmetsp:Transcript_6839/g.25844  ORF Transcript_6839/g.25844 Transcript_6839/m.25844 type:complete len:324 (+) Transcript_6839:1034-2005(+)